MATQPPPVPPDPNQGPTAPPPVTPAKVAPPQPGAAPQAQGQPAASPVPGEEIVAVEVGFWQQPFVQNVLPFLTSLVLHISLVLLGFLTLKAVQVVTMGERLEQIIIPEAELMETEGDPSGVPHPGLGGDPTRDARQDQYPDVPKDSKGIAERPGPNLIPSLSGGGAGDAEGAAIIGVGLGGIGKGTGFGSGSGEGSGSGDGDGRGVLAPFGVPGGGAGLGRAGFIGVRGNAKRIVYLCDASGTMLNVFDRLRMELHKSIGGLSPVQSFNVIFFSDDAAYVLNKGGLLPATPENKRKAFEFIDMSTARGSTNPTPAIRAAFAHQPELIYCLTDGFDAVASFDEVADEFRKLNRENKVKVNTLLIESSSQPELRRILERIAKENGGLMKIVREEDW